MKEIYKDIPEYEGKYQVSNWGRVKTLSDRWNKQRLLKPGIASNGYLSVCLHKDGKGKTFNVHQLVAITFLGHIPNGLETVVNHIDKNPLNNRVDNLELVSNRYNSSCHKTDVGVSWSKRTNKWDSRIVVNKKLNYLGSFNDKQDGLDRYQLALANLDNYENPKQFREFLKNI